MNEVKFCDIYTASSLFLSLLCGSERLNCYPSVEGTMEWHGNTQNHKFNIYLVYFLKIAINFYSNFYKRCLPWYSVLFKYAGADRISESY